MGVYEDELRRTIKVRFGSIPKMAEATGIAATTIYHALDRGMENTRTETSRKIKDAIYGSRRPFVQRVYVVPGEYELIDLFHSMDDEGRERLIEMAEFLVARHPAEEIYEFPEYEE